MKTKQVKQQDLTDLRTEFEGVQSAFLVNFSGLTVPAVDDLRSRVRAASGRYRVVKNTLARSAAEGTDLAPLAGEFTGPTAVVTTSEDVAQVIKVLVDFSKENPAIAIRGGIVAGTPLDGQQCRSLADIPSREELLSKLAYLLQSPMQRLATVLQAPARNLAVVLAQGAEKRESPEG